MSSHVLHTHATQHKIFAPLWNTKIYIFPSYRGLKFKYLGHTRRGNDIFYLKHVQVQMM